MNTFVPLIIGIGCLAYLTLIIKNIIYTVIDSDSSGKLLWGTRRKITDWIGFSFLILGFIVVAFFGIGGIVVFIKNIM